MRKKDFIKYIPLGLLVFFVLTLPYTGILLYNYWKGFIDAENGYNGINAVIAYAGGIINIITVVFLFINYIQQKKQIEDQKKELEFNKITQLVQNQLIFTKDVLGDRSVDFHALKQITKIDYTFTIDYYYIHYENIYRQLQLYKKYLTNNLSTNDNDLIFSLISTNFLDNHIDEIRYVYSLYNNINVNEIITETVYEHYKIAYDNNKHNLGYKYGSVVDITKEMIDKEYKEFVIESIDKLHKLSHMLKDIVKTYDKYSD